MFLKIKDVTKESSYSIKIKNTLLIHFHAELFFCDTATVGGSKNSHNVVQLNPYEDNYYHFTLYPTLMQPSKKFLPESIRAIAYYN